MEAASTKDFYCDFVLNNKIEVEKVKETDRVLAFRHTKPSWDIHIIVIPKEHVDNLLEIKDFSIINEIFKVTAEIINDLKLSNTNYRIISNGGSFQDSKHLHFHLVSGNKIK